VLVGDPPDSPADPAAHGSILAVFPLAGEHPFKAVRVRSATNVILLRSLPGIGEAKPPADACGSCIGKHFVAKGAAATAGLAAGQMVREEDLPANVRIIRPTDGVVDVRPNPNRLTIVVGEDGRVVDTLWE